MSEPMLKSPATFTVDSSEVGHLYYFAPADRALGPYLKQIRVDAIIDVAADGTLAGVELIDGMPPPPIPRDAEVDTITMLRKTKEHLANILFALGKDVPDHPWLPQGQKGLDEAKAYLAAAETGMDDWQQIDTAPQFVPVMTKIDDVGGVRNEFVLVREGRLWFLVGKTTYVYYEPTHWRRASEEEIANAT